MIIIETTNGNYFLSDRDYNFVAHSKTERKVKAYRVNDIEDDFDNVETLTYTNEANPASFTFKDPCETKKEKTIELYERALAASENDMRQFANEMINLVNSFAKELPEHVRNAMRNRSEEIKAKVNHGFYRQELDK